MAVDWDAVARNHEYDCLGAVVLDAEGTIRGVSENILTLSGFEREDVIGLHSLEVLHPDDVDRGIRVLGEVMVTPGTRAEGMYRLRLNNGDYNSYALRAINLGPESGGAIVYRIDSIDGRTRLAGMAFAEDVVDATRMLCEEISLAEWFDWAIRLGERHISGLHVIGTIFEDGGPNTIYSRDDVPSDLLEANLHAHAGALPPHVQTALEEHRRGPWLAPNRVATRDDVRPERLTSVLVDRDGGVVGYLEVLRPDTGPPPEPEWLLHAMITRVITAAMQRISIDQQLRWAAEHDPLTGLVNRRKLLELMQEEPLHGGQLLLVDVDRFSDINNAFGHTTGDHVLTTLGDCLASVCPDGSVIARIGGDEFVAWVPATAVAAPVEVQGDVAAQALKVTLNANGGKIVVQSSIGAIEIAPGQTAAAAISAADDAMYRAKRSGGGLVVYQPA